MYSFSQPGKNLTSLSNNVFFLLNFLRNMLFFILAENDVYHSVLDEHKPRHSQKEVILIKTISLSRLSVGKFV